MSQQKKTYPDICEILARKQKWRHERANLSFAEKRAALDALRERVGPLVRAREERRSKVLAGALAPK